MPIIIDNNNKESDLTVINDNEELHNTFKLFNVVFFIARHHFLYKKMAHQVPSQAKQDLIE